jgi:hypothetical protein
MAEKILAFLQIIYESAGAAPALKPPEYYILNEFIYF